MMLFSFIFFSKTEKLTFPSISVQLLALIRGIFWSFGTVFENQYCGTVVELFSIEDLQPAIKP